MMAHNSLKSHGRSEPNAVVKPMYPNACGEQHPNHSPRHVEQGVNQIELERSHEKMIAGCSIFAAPSLATSPPHHTRLLSDAVTVTPRGGHDGRPNECSAGPCTTSDGRVCSGSLGVDVSSLPIHATMRHSCRH